MFLPGVFREAGEEAKPIYYTTCMGISTQR